jgi:hypothetical protein
LRAFDSEHPTRANHGVLGSPAIARGDFGHALVVTDNFRRGAVVSRQSGVNSARVFADPKPEQAGETFQLDAESLSQREEEELLGVPTPQHPGGAKGETVTVAIEKAKAAKAALKAGRRRP